MTGTAAVLSEATAAAATVFTAQAILDSLAIAIFAPTLVGDAPDPRLQHDNKGGHRTWRKRSDDKCDDGPGVSKNGHLVYQPRERYYDDFTQQEECRATGIYGLVDYSDLTVVGKKGPGTDAGTKKPPGMAEIVSQGQTPTTATWGRRPAVDPEPICGTSSRSTIT